MEASQSPFLGLKTYSKNPYRKKGEYVFFSLSIFFWEKKNREKKSKSKNEENLDFGKSIFGLIFESIFDRKMTHFRCPFWGRFWTPILDPILEVLQGPILIPLLMGAKIIDLSQGHPKGSILGPKMGPKMAQKRSKKGPKWHFFHALYVFFAQNRENPENGHFGVQNGSFWVILGSKMGQNRSFWVILGSKIDDFGSFWGPKWENPKIAIFDVFLMKNALFSTFWCPGIHFWGRFLRGQIQSGTPK